MRPLILLGFLTLLVVPARAVEFCFLPFVGLTDAEAPEELILRTYTDLLSELGALKQAEGFAQRWFDSKDPFKVPEPENVTLDVLQRKLKQFEEMLKGKGWVTEPVREILLEKLKQDSVAKQEAVEKLRPKVADNANSFIFEVADATEVPPEVHPSQKWILVPRHTNPRENHPKDTEGAVYDIDKRQLIPYRTRIADFRAAKFVQDGKAVLFGDEFNVAQLVPFANGNLDFTKAVKIGEPTGSKMQVNQIQRFLPSPVENVWYGHGIGRMGIRIFKFDLNTKVRTELDIEKYLGLQGKSVTDWGVVPHSDRLYFLTSDPNELRLHEATVSADGTITDVSAAPNWPRKNMDPNVHIGPVIYSPDGKYIFVNEKLRLSRIDAAGVPQKLSLPPIGKTGAGYGSFGSIAIHPNGEEAVILRKANPNAGLTAEIVEYPSMVHLKTVPIVEHGGDVAAVQFMPDGKSLFFTGGADSG